MYEEEEIKMFKGSVKVKEEEEKISEISYGTLKEDYNILAKDYECLKQRFQDIEDIHKIITLQLEKRISVLETENKARINDLIALNKQLLIEKTKEKEEFQNKIDQLEKRSDVETENKAGINDFITLNKQHLIEKAKEKEEFQNKIDHLEKKLIDMIQSKSSSIKNPELLSDSTKSLSNEAMEMEHNVEKKSSINAMDAIVISDDSEAEDDNLFRETNRKRQRFDCRSQEQPKKMGRDGQRLKKASPKEEAKGVSMSAQPPTSSAVKHSVLPWPRPDGQPFTGGVIDRVGLSTTIGQLRDYGIQNRAPNEPWGDLNSIYYNGWLRITLKPTRVICRDTLREMGILDDVVKYLEKIGLGTLPFQGYPLYPELARQFFASVELHMRIGVDVENALNAYITFFSRGHLYKLTIPQICEIYGFAQDRTAMKYPDGFHRFLWQRIGTDVAFSHVSKIARIRNPVLRVVAKIIGSLFLGPEEADSMTASELILLHYGLPESTHEMYPWTVYDLIPERLETNLGYKFAQNLLNRKDRGLTVSKGKKEYMGNLLTSIFEACGIDLSREESEDKIGLMDVKHFKNAHILRGDSSTYEYTDREGVVRHCTLPVDKITSSVSLASLEFEVPVKYRCD